MNKGATVYRVSQVNDYIKRMVSSDLLLSNICVRGEVSNFRGVGSSGHIYFTLKEAGSEISVAMWRSSRAGLKGELKNGDEVMVTGKVDVYSVRGTYQIIANTIEPVGVGDLFVKFEKLKKELLEMGMFAEEYKKPIPEYITTLGVVTAPTGAAIRDVIQIAHRRNPYVRIILSPALVQGEGAAESIALAIKRLDAIRPDVMIVGRGGGSIEDLWAFNEEIVARAIFDAETPVISAVGHETDTTIADYVSDRRAPTPSAAAELAVFSYDDYAAALERYRDDLYDIISRRIGYLRMELAADAERLKKYSPQNRLAQLRSELKNIRLLLNQNMSDRLNDHKKRLAIIAERLDGRSPAKKLSGGYAFARDGAGRRLTSVSQVKKDDKISINVTDGMINAKVTDVIMEK